MERLVEKGLEELSVQVEVFGLNPQFVDFWHARPPGIAERLEIDFEWLVHAANGNRNSIPPPNRSLEGPVLGTELAGTVATKEEWGLFAANEGQAWMGNGEYETTAGRKPGTHTANHFGHDVAFHVVE